MAQSASTSTSSRRTIHLSLELSEDLDDLLDELAGKTAGTKSDVLRKAIALIEVAVKAKEDGRQLAIVDENGRVVTTIVGL